MPEKKSGGFVKAIEDYVTGFITEAVSFFFSEVEKRIDEAVSLSFSLIEKRLKQYAVSLVIMIASLAVIIYGIGTLVEYLIPTLVPGTSYIIVGVLFLWAAMAYSKQ